MCQFFVLLTHVILCLLHRKLLPALQTANFLFLFDNWTEIILVLAHCHYSYLRLRELMCTANTNVSAAVNSSFEFNCSRECKSDISWSYVLLQHNSRSLLSPACLEDGRCEIRNSTAMGQSLSIDQVQFNDSGTYLCSSGRKDRPDCEMSFRFTGKLLWTYFTRILLALVTVVFEIII